MIFCAKCGCDILVSSAGPGLLLIRCRMCDNAGVCEVKK